MLQPGGGKDVVSLMTKSARYSPFSSPAGRPGKPFPDRSWTSFRSSCLLRLSGLRL